ncbi:MAG: hypothetical protein ACYSWU_10885 [Planctomycetota bacterium]|jgi:hypothetical protein
MNTNRTARFLLAALGMSAFCGRGDLRGADDVVAIDNGVVSVRYDVNSGAFSARREAKEFLQRGTFGDFLPDAEAKVRAVDDFPDSLGSGGAIRVEHPSGRTATLFLRGDKPFVFVRTSIRNSKKKPITVKQFTPLAARIDLPGAAKDLRTLGYDGLAAADQPKTTYMCLSVAEPKTRAGVVCGWLTHDRASGIALCRPEGEKVRVEARSEYGRLLVPAGETVFGETMMIGYFDDVLDGLELYAETIAKHYEIKVKPVPSGYMTWYHARALDEERMPVLAKWSAANLKRYGFDFLQIDDGWQVSRRDFTTHAVDRPYASKPRFPDEPGRDKAPYSRGMKPTAEAIDREGFAAGIWITPFGWDHKRPAFADHQDWFVKREDGSVYAVSWGGDCLDMSHPEARKFVAEVVDRIANRWGYKFFKLDALWAGICAKQLYPDPRYRDDDFGDAVRHDPEVTNTEAFRKGLEVVRRAAGDDCYLLGCTAAQNMRTLGGSVGLVDAIRVGIDSGRKWDGIVANAKVSGSVYYLHGRVWHNDADVLYLDEHFTLDQVRCWASWLAVTGNLYMVSNWLPGVPAERIEVIRRTIPNHNLKARPVDLFETSPARVWHLRHGEGESRRDVVAFFNWGDRQQKIEVELSRLGLSPTHRYATFDFWENELTGHATGVSSLEMTVRPKSCRVIALRRMDHPLVISTSRHVTQGIVDVVEEKWDPARSTIRGVSRVVAGDPYEIRTVAPSVVEPWQVDLVSVSAADEQAGVTVKIAAEKKRRNARIVINSPVSREVAWSIQYMRGKSVYPSR